MNTKELNEYIKSYFINDKTNRAIMLTAEWGSGKSFYIKNDLVKFLKDKNDISCVIVSLYGVNKLSELSKNIYIEARAKWLNKKSEKGSIGKIIAKTIAKNVAGHFGIDLSISENDLQKLYESVDLSDKLLILEDVERTSINIIELMGFVNNLCEQDGAKVLLVANEDAIKKYESKEKTNTKGEKIVEKCLTTESREYVRIKEKTIGDTLNFIGERESIIKGIFEKFDNKYFADLLKDYNGKEYNITTKILAIMDSNKSYNYRSFLYACQKTDDIIRKLEKNNYDIEFIENLFLGTVSYLTKKEIIDKWDEVAFTSKKLGSYAYPLYKVMFDYIKRQDFNESLMLYMEQVFKKTKEISKLDDYLKKLYGCTNRTEIEIKEAIDKLEEGLKNKILPSTDFVTIANYLIFIKSVIGYSEKIHHCLELMLQNAKELAEKGEKVITESFSGIELLDKDSIKEFAYFKNKLNATVNVQFSMNIEDYSYKSLNNFYNRIQNEHSGFINYGGFAKLLDINKLLEQLKSSSSAEIGNIRGLFLSAYRSFSNINQYFKDDLNNLISLQNGIDEIIKKPVGLDLIQQQQLKWFSSNLEEIISRLQQ